MIYKDVWLWPPMVADSWLLPVACPTPTRKRDSLLSILRCHRFLIDEFIEIYNNENHSMWASKYFMVENFFEEFRRIGPAVPQRRVRSSREQSLRVSDRPALRLYSQGKRSRWNVSAETSMRTIMGQLITVWIDCLWPKTEPFQSWNYRNIDLFW